MSMPECLASMVLDMGYAWNEEEKVWFIGEKLKYLFCADIKKKEISIISELSSMCTERVKEYIRVIKYENRLIFLPGIAKDILIYNLETHGVKTVSIKNCEDITSIWCTSAGIVGDKLYIVETYQLRRIMILDITKGEILAIYDIKCIDSDDLIGTQSTIHKGYIYIPVLTKEKIISFDMNTYEFEEHFIAGDICGCRSICHDNKYCWIIGEHYGIVRWNPDTDESAEPRDIPKEFKIFARDKLSRRADWYAYSKKRKYVWDNDYFCWECFHDGKYVWVIPELSNSIMRIDTNMMQVKLFSFRSEYQGRNVIYGRNGSEFLSWGVDSNRNLRIVSKRNYRIYCIETENLSYQIEEWSLSKKAIELLVNGLLTQKMMENRWFNLEAMVYFVVESQTKRNSQGNMEIGTKIYNSLH